MKKLAIAPEISILFFFSIFLMTENGWAVASYAQKHGLGCKSCHAFGSELNSLGKSFKKNGYSFGEKNASQKDSVNPSTARDNNSGASKTSVATSDTFEMLNKGRVNGTADVSAASETEQPQPEAKYYTWKSDDGTFHFSDRTYANPPSEKNPIAVRFGKKDRGSKSKPLSAIVPKHFQKPSVKTISNEMELDLSTRKNSIETPETGKIVTRPESFERCMEQTLVAFPPPKTPDVAMEQFREAETICTPSKKRNR